MLQLTNDDNWKTVEGDTQPLLASGKDWSYLLSPNKFQTQRWVQQQLLPSDCADMEQTHLMFIAKIREI